MSKLTSLIRRAPKRTSAVIAMIAAAIIVPAAVFAWGPSRPTFTYESPAPYVTFNSITNNPTVGDERNFVRIREAGVGTFTDSAALTAGKTYEVSLYFHNNAKTSLNASGAGIAKDATARIQMPGALKAGEAATITGFVNSSNANPTSVWDEAKGTNGSDAVALRYVQSSAKFTSNGAVNGQTVPDSLFTTGAKLGFNSQDGTLPGCNEFAGYITFKFVVDKPNFTVEKQVSVDGGKTWGQEAPTKAGDTIEYRIIYKNTGTTQQDNVVLRDYLPAGVSYVPGSTQVANAKTGGQYKATVDGVTAGGFDIGSYTPNSNAYLKFKAKVATHDTKYVCGTNTLKNIARATTSGGYKEDDAIVKFNKVCEPPKEIQVCELATKKIVTIKESEFNTSKYSKNLDDCKEPGKITVCELATKKIVTIKESDFNSTKYSKNLDDCKEVPPVTPPVTPPAVLPTTGMTENIVAILGLGALIASIAYYVASRRALV